MSDPSGLLETLSDLSDTLTCRYGIGDVLDVMAQRIPELLDLTGAAVTLVKDGRPRLITAPVERIADLERAQEQQQAGPCPEAVRAGHPVTVADMTAATVAQRWPVYAAQARVAGIRAVAGVPMVTDGRPLGAIDLYDARRRDWSEQDLRVAGIMADIATVYLVYAVEADRHRRTAEQLHQALDTRVVIEQAKGMLAAADHITVDEAFQLLRKHAREQNARIHDVAHAVVRLGLHLHP